MALRWYSIVVDCGDVAAQARWWRDTLGWQVVHDRYKARYDTRAKMGTLAFSELEFKPLSEFYMMAVGRWQLTRDADTPHGRFTLIFRRTNAGWRIVHDHTSSE